MTNPASDFYNIHLVQSSSDYMPLCHFTATAVKKKSKEINIYNRLHAIIHKKTHETSNELCTHPTLPALPCFRYYRRRNPQTVYQ